MKTIISLILLWLTVNCTGQNFKDGFIQMSINVTQDNYHFYDNNTVVTINCMSDGLTYKDTSSNFTLILHPDKEYMLTFKRQGCIDKNIFVSTIHMPKSSNYMIKAQINLLSGKTEDSKELFGKLVYNHKTDSFDKQIIAKNEK